MTDEQLRGDRGDGDPDEGELLASAGGGEVRATATPDDVGERLAPQHPLGPPPTTLTMPATQYSGGTERVTVASFRENMLLVGSDGETLGAIDGPAPGDSIRLKPDALGQHHWVPLSWVARVDDQAHLDRSTRQARQ